jgi:hypothetical protein
MDPRGPARWTRFDHLLLVACALLPAALAATGVSAAAPASHDEGVVRVVGLGWTGLFRGLDALLGAALMLVPIGTRALRGGLASALVTAGGGALAFVIARRLASTVRPGAASPALISAAAGVAALSAVLAPLWQTEASAPSGAVVGAAIVLGALVLAPREGGSEAAGLRPLALLLGLAASYEPLVLAATIAAIAPSLERAVRARALSRRALLDAAPAFALGLAPMAFAAALARRAPELAIVGAKPFASPLGEGSVVAARVGIGAFAVAEIGVLLLVAAGAGAVLAALVPAARRLLASLAGVIAIGLLALLLRAPSGPAHASAAVLAATAAAAALAAVALAAVVVAISKAPVPFAQASAALVVVLELVLPVHAADETLGRRAARAPNASTVWNEVAWGAAPPAAVLLVSQPATMRRIAASRATGHMRTDLLVVPTFALPSRVTDRALKAEPKLASLYRDVALGSTPEELSLATLASERPVLASFDPRWDRNLARHFVPVGLTTRYESEPRGASDRRKALEAFSVEKERLVRVAVARKDVELASATARLLRARAVGMAACGERDVLSRALDDLRPFAPDDAVANTLVRRMVTNKSHIDVRDLVP